MRTQATTCFRVEVKRDNGLWAFLFDADFQSAITEVRKFKARGIQARMTGSQDGQTTRKATPKRRTDHRAVR